MPTFVMNRHRQANGDLEVHNKTTGCTFMPLPENQIDLGVHPTCHGAVLQAKRMYHNERINGCKYCCSACHTT